MSRKKLISSLRHWTQWPYREEEEAEHFPSSGGQRDAEPTAASVTLDPMPYSKEEVA